MESFEGATMQVDADDDVDIDDPNDLSPLIATRQTSGRSRTRGSLKCPTFLKKLTRSRTLNYTDF